jgi:hypothetical protein
MFTRRSYKELDHFPCLKAVTVSMLTSRPFWLEKRKKNTVEIQE